MRHPESARNRNLDLPLAFYNGDILPLAEVRIPATDRAYLFGDAVYEVVRVYHGAPWLLPEHLGRLENSLRGLSIEHGGLADTVSNAAGRLLNQSGVEEGILYIQVSRGAAPRRHVPRATMTPNILVYVDAFNSAETEKKREQGIALRSMPDPRWSRCDIKSVNLLGNVLGAMSAEKHGADDVLFLDETGCVTETSHASFFVVKGKEVIAPPYTARLLPGITRDYIVRTLPKDLLFKAAQLPIADMSTWDEAFVTGTTTEIIAVRAIDGASVGSGTVGPIVKRLHERFRAATLAAEKK